MRDGPRLRLRPEPAASAGAPHPPQGPEASAMKKRSVTIRGHRTSVSLESAFWDALKETAAQDGRTVSALVAEIDSTRGPEPLSSAIRVHLLGRYRARAGGARA